MMPSNKGYALFDLDQTLVPWDMQLLFANWVFHKYPWRRIYLIFFFTLLPLFKLLGAEIMKRAFLCILHGLSAREVESLTQDFVDHYYPDIFYPEIVEKMRAHQERGDFVILTSASPSLYVQKIGHKLGANLTFGTDLNPYEFYPLFPQFPIGNNKGHQKILTLKWWLYLQDKDEQFPLPSSTAYTDSSADIPLIDACQDAVLVHPSERLQNHAPEATVFTPERPFSDKKGQIKIAVTMLAGLYPIR